MSNATVELKVPSVGESVTEVEIAEWLKNEGDPVRMDESVVVLETDKATVEVPSPVAGRLAKIDKQKGDRVQVGDVLGHVEAGEFASAALKPAGEKEMKHDNETARKETGVRVMPAAARLMAEKGIALEGVQPTGPGGRVLKEDVQRAAQQVKTPASGPSAGPSATIPPATMEAARAEEVVPMSLLRRKIAERLVQAQHNAALLTTFNEIDMSAVLVLRKEHQKRFQDRYKIKLGFMSFFVKAAVEALKEIPQLNAEIRDTNIVYRNYYDIGIAIGGGRGLVVPVLRSAEQMSFAEVEQAITDFAQKVQENKIRPEHLQGGTFTITNGGVYGSLLSTPLINPPQSGVLGMHAIQERPVALNGQVVIRPMMYVALTYDHRIVDGREAVIFLKRVKDLVENPVRMLIET
ncbi:MAG TPA: 2-oxoglutarate dehydrogenase complex dihydrolipoyllysine-residue succinyltransferase [Anaerolineales bacterium]|jgi:2-oxoglutarate dehydrogenase E2 component (dihydrolipoamide succinyltransferase)